MITTNNFSLRLDINYSTMITTIDSELALLVALIFAERSV